jgi:enamine deaminase RidA (YjgF/YER057c/UK114 family)
MPVSEDRGVLQLQWGAALSSRFPLGLPLLRGDSVVNLFPSARPLTSSSCFRLFESGEFLLGFARAKSDGDLTDNAFKLYLEALEAVGRKHLCRVWNFIPAINAEDACGQENYRSFCKGRSMAFEAALGQDFNTRLPAASAVGTDDSHLMVAFVAHRDQPQHFENPLQVPAYSYPGQYGPRSPSFARATTLCSDGVRHCFVSGTAAIRGHATVMPDDTEAQLRCTLENLQVIMERCGMPGRGEASAGSPRLIKVYLRQEGDVSLVEDVLRSQLLGAGDRVSYLRSDICRANLRVEIELTALNVPMR